MDITGTLNATSYNGTASGAFSLTATNRTHPWDGTGSLERTYQFTASNSWTGSTNSTGAHSHTVTVSSTGTMRDDGKVYPTSVSMRWYIKF